MTEQAIENLLREISFRCEYAMNADKWADTLAEIHAIMDLIDAAQGKHEIRDAEIPF